MSNPYLEFAAVLALISISHQLRCIRGIMQGAHPKWWQL